MERRKDASFVETTMFGEEKNCPAFGKTCTKWGGINHFMKACRKFNQKVNKIPEDDGFDIH